MTGYVFNLEIGMRDATVHVLCESDSLDIPALLGSLRDLGLIDAQFERRYPVHYPLHDDVNVRHFDPPDLVQPMMQTRDSEQYARSWRAFD